MRTRTVAPLAMALALAFVPVVTIRGEAVPDDPPEEPAAGQEFPWICFAVSVAAVGALYVQVRRRERQVEADQRRGDRDVSGPVCPAAGRRDRPVGGAAPAGRAGGGPGPGADVRPGAEPGNREDERFTERLIG